MYFSEIEMRIRSTYLALLAVLLSPMAVNADPIEYDYGVTTDGGWDFSLSVVFDSADIAFNTDIGALMESWSASWTLGSTTWSTDSTLEGWFESVFVLSDINTVFSTALCSGTCQAGDHPVFYSG